MLPVRAIAHLKGAVTVEYEIMVERCLVRENCRNAEKNVSSAISSTMNIT